MIELKGIVEFYDQGKKNVDVVVAENSFGPNVQHRLGVDIKVNRGMILKFLAEHYGILAGEIVWPAHIVVKEDQD